MQQVGYECHLQYIILLRLCTKSLPVLKGLLIGPSICKTGCICQWLTVKSNCCVLLKVLSINIVCYLPSFHVFFFSLWCDPSIFMYAYILHIIFEYVGNIIHQAHMHIQDTPHMMIFFLLQYSLLWNTKYSCHISSIFIRLCLSFLNRAIKLTICVCVRECVVMHACMHACVRVWVCGEDVSC